MSKAARILNLIGYVLEILLALFFIFFFVISFIIVMPNSRQIIVDGLNNGTITRNPAMTLDQNVEYIQHLFIGATIIFFFLSAIFVVESIFSILIAKKEENRKFLIPSLILSIISLNALLIIANIMALKEEETIVVS